MRSVLLWVAAVSACAVSACGDIVKKTDGGPDDGGGGGGDGSGSADAPPPAPITVHVRGTDGAPDLGANVLIMTDAGDIVYDGLVDATGKVTIEMPTRGWVTSRSVVMTGNRRDVSMTTVRDVEPNDEIWLGPPPLIRDNAVANSNRAFSFTRYGSSAEHTFYVPCGNRYFAASNTNVTGTVPINDACVPPTFSFLGTATLGNMRLYAYVPNQTRASTTTIIVPSTWTNMGTVNATFSNVPSGMEYFSGTRWTLLDDVPTLNAQFGAPNPAAGGTIGMQFPYAPVGSGVRYNISLGNQTTGERQWVTLRTSTVGATIGFDYNTLNLPRLLSVPTYDPTDTRFSWTETAGTFTPDARILHWNAHFMDGNTQVDVHWQIIDGQHGTSMILPTLPDSYRTFDPRKLAGYRDGGDNYIYYVDCDMVSNPKIARSLNATLLLNNTDLKAELGADYRCRTSESAYNDAIP